MQFPIPECAKDLPFSENIIFYPDSFDFDFDFEISSLENNNNNIPKLIHLIWVGENNPPPYFESHVLGWQERMPDWEIRVWRNEDINVDHFPPAIIDIINLCEKGAQKADIMRYFIVEKYGGVYLDSDITPHRSLDPLLKIPDAKAIICHDLPLTWQYISIGFFAAEPNHPLFKLLCLFCYQIEINTEDVHMKSGPRLFGEAVSRINDNKIILLPFKFFYRNEDYDGRFGFHFYAKNW